MSASDKQVSFSVEELTQDFAQTRGWEVSYERLFHDKTMISLYYEDLVASPEIELKKVTDLLGVRFTNLKAQHRKQNSESLPALVTNYGELKQAFQLSQWASFFEN